MSWTWLSPSTLDDMCDTQGAAYKAQLSSAAHPNSTSPCCVNKSLNPGAGWQTTPGGLTQSPTPAPRGPGTWGARGALGTESDGAGSSTEQQATSKEQRERELAASAFQELDDDMDGA